MHKTLAEIAKIVGGELIGDGNLLITGLSGIKEAKEGDLTFIANQKYFPLIKSTRASAAIVPSNLADKGKPVIVSDNPTLAFSKVSSIFSDEMSKHFTGIHKTAIISDTAKLGRDVAVGPYTIISDKAQIGDGTIIYSGCFIGEETSIGKNCLFYPNVVVREKLSIGNRVIVHSGAVIGADGFGYTEAGGIQHKIPQLGTVVIEDDVEIGSNTTIDRARFDKTVVGQGTKIDNLVQIAHNVIIGKNCIIISQVGISGSVEIEDKVTLAGQAGVVGHIRIGAGAVVAAQACVTKSVTAGVMVSGYPAKPHDLAKRISASLQRLPEYVKKISELQERVRALETMLKKTGKTSARKKAKRHSQHR